ncbi:hypothetical protein DY000_02000651 [Brassica cretica]|uniref:Protein kinase domain-containing protein n=1 Tax=Brassica cretica TaxID=69181 RepID=A0ABQ7CAP9_BRACR|nr:hypothetical protein DY000_02000651 [Brassica cretica]
MRSSTIVMMMRRSLVYLLGFLYLLTSVNGLLSSNGVNFEVQALMDIKASLHDPHGVLDSWDRDAVDPCSWTMVTCSSENFVIGLGTPSQNLSGTLSPSITNLTNLRIVLLQNNNITGKIPSEFGRLTRLETLDLSDNFFHVPRFAAKTFSIVGNPLICPTGKEPDCNGTTLIPMSMNLNDTGAARGLVYLHEQCDPKIIHRDVKAANILLDDYCEAVVGDFGLAKLLDHQDSHVTTAVRGTVGHIAPEYLSTGQSSEKTDVFGFGILLLELVTGQRALEFGKAANQKGAMLEWVKKIHQEKNLEVLVDKQLLKNKSYDEIELEEMVRVALLCTQYLPGHRPKMSEVVRMLEGDGLAERWEASQRSESGSKYSNRVNELMSSSDRYSDLTDDSTLLAQAMELSGPR